MIWATAFVFNKYGLEELAPIELAFYRYFMASLMLIPFAIKRKIKIPTKKSLWLSLIGCGFFGIALYNVLLYNGQLLVPVGTASLLVNIAPLFTAILSVIFLKEKLSAIGWAGLFVSFVGVVFIVSGKNSSLDFDSGSLYVLGAAITFSIYHIVQKPVLAHFSGLDVIIYSIWVSAIILLPGAFGLIDKWESISYKTHFSALYLAVFPGALGYISWAEANKLMPASKASSFLFLTPVFAFIFSYFALGEVPTLVTIAGGALALFGVYMVIRFGK